MKIGIAIVFLLLITGLGFLALAPQPESLSPKISLHSDPFPLVIGPTRLTITVKDADGNNLDAALSVSVSMMHQGMLSINSQTSQNENGEFRASIIWPMAGQWMIDITAQLPDNQGSVRDQFEVFVYATTKDITSQQLSFPSVSQTRALVSDPARELAIVIPQGTQTLMLEGQADDVIPSEIRLNVQGVNTLILQNNDIVDHTIGPFTIHAGETLRQTFTRPALYQGTCSINLQAEVNIIVED